MSLKEAIEKEQEKRHVKIGVIICVLFLLFEILMCYYFYRLGHEKGVLEGRLLEINKNTVQHQLNTMKENLKNNSSRLDKLEDDYQLMNKQVEVQREYLFPTAVESSDYVSTQ